MFKPGTIRKIQVKNFVTYTFVEFYPGPNLNMIIGPNGTGKSTMVAAIVLGLGGTPKIVGRGVKVSEYVKHGSTEATINIHLQGNEENNFIKITRIFDTTNKNAWFVNGERKTLKDVLDSIEPFNIQVNNLCQFLPQDRVQDFAKMNKQEILRATQLALCKEDLLSKQDQLISSKKRHDVLSEFIQQNENKLSEAKEINSRLESKVQNFNKKKKYMEEVEHVDRKVAWLQYDCLRENLDVVKKDKRTATEIYENYKKATLPMEKEIKAAKDKCMKLKEIHSNILRNSKEAQINLESEFKEHDNIKQSSSKALQKMRMNLNEFDERNKEIDETSKTIVTLKSAREKLLEKCGNDEQVLQKLQRIKTEIDESLNKTRSIEDKKQELLARKQYEESELRYMKNEMRNLENVKHMRLEKLKQMDKQVHSAVLWFRNNKHLFKGIVCEPMMLEVDVLEKKNAIFLENVIARRDKLAFTCENKDDMNLLIHSLRNQQKLSVNVLHSSVGVDKNKYQPVIPIEKLRQFGLYAYLDSLFTAPDLIMNYLYNCYGIQNIPVGDKKVNECYQQIPQQIRLFFSDKQRYSVKFSKYSGEKSVKQNEISTNETLSVSIDVMRSRNLENSIEEKRRKCDNIENEILKYDQHSQQFQNRTKELEEELQNFKEFNLKIQEISHRCAKMEKKIEGLMNSNTEKEKIKQEAEKKIQKFTRELVEHQNKIHKSFKILNKLNLKLALSGEKIDLAERAVIQLENDFSEKRRQCRESEERLAQVKERYAEILGRAKSALQKAKNLSKGFTPAEEGFEEFLPKYNQLSNDQKVLLIEKDQLLSKIDCLKIPEDEEMKEYEARIEIMKNLDKDLDESNRELNLIEAKMQKLEEEWLNPLCELITAINERFSLAFSRMKCSGELSIWTGNNPTDYSDYGLCIKVSYRHGEPLQELNSTTQSGGERAVATAIFMLSLQELTPVPFRCVDEINQGMDANNERRIIDLLFDCTSQINSSQYFFITPKLIPNLNYPQNVMIHVVHNGPFINSDRKWYKSDLCNPQRVEVNV